MIEIGDFGPGSDQPIFLDYQKNRKEPNVLRFACKIVRSGPEGWRKSWDNHWVNASWLHPNPALSVWGQFNSEATG